MSKAVVIWFVVLLCISYSGCQNISDARALRRRLFTALGYDKTVRPVDEQSKPVEITVSLFLLSMNGLNEATEVLTTTGYLYVEWRDVQLAWSQAEYGGLTDSFWPQDDIWKPDLTLQNSAVPYQALGDSTLHVHVNSSGHVVWRPFQVFECSCPVSIKYFPYDMQTCEMEFVAWSYRKTEVTLKGVDNRVNALVNYEPNPVWDILDVSWEFGDGPQYSSITFSVGLKRKPLFIILTIVLPLLLLSLLNTVAFLLPADGGEKASYAVTIFLTFAIFLTIVEASLPPNSETFPILSIYIIVMTCNSALVTVITLLLCRMSSYDKKNKVLPPCLNCFYQIGMWQMFKTGARIEQYEMDIPVKNGTNGDDNGVVENENVRDTTRFPQSEHIWLTVVDGIDRVCLLIFGIISLVACIVFFSVVTNA